MPRRGRSPSPQHRASVPARTAPTPPAPVHAPAASPMVVQQQQPSMFKQMAATAAGVAAGSAVGHVIGHGMTNMLSGGGGNEVAAAPAPAAAASQGYAPQQQEPSGPCAFEIKQFLKCAQDQADLSLCSGFNEAIRQCKENNHLV